MAILATGQPPPGVVQASTITPNPSLTPQSQNQTYKSVLHPQPVTVENFSIPAPSFDLHHGEPSFVWEDKVVDVMMRHEELHYAVVGKFSYGMPEFHELRKQIPLQCEIKGECSIGFLETRHVVIRLSLLEDYVHLLSRPAFSLKLGVDFYSMRTMKYDVWFDPREETSIAIAWISFPGLPPAFFVKDAVFALASAVGKPLQLDAATKAKTRPSCAKVKVEVDLLATRPQRLRLGIKNSSNGEIRYKWIRIRYDFMPKYCKACRLQGHNEEECFSLHPELLTEEDIKDQEDHSLKKDTVKQAPLKVLQSGKIVGNVYEGGEVAPVQTQVRQGKNSNKYIHPNRNPKAWTRVEKKTKQVTIDNARSNQGETMVLANAFATLDNVDVIRDDVIKSTQPQVISTQQVSVDGAKEKSHSSRLLESSVVASKGVEQIGTRSWVREAFKHHPKVDAAGVSVKSGTGKSIEAGGQAARIDRATGLNLDDAELTRVLEAAREGDSSGIEANLNAAPGFNASGSEAEGVLDSELMLSPNAGSALILGAKGLVPSAINVQQPSALLVHGNDGVGIDAALDKIPLGALKLKEDQLVEAGGPMGINAEGVRDSPRMPIIELDSINKAAFNIGGSQVGDQFIPLSQSACVDDFEAVGTRGNLLVNEALNDVKSRGEVVDSQVVEVEGIFNAEGEIKRGVVDPSASASRGCVDFNSLSRDVETPAEIKVMTDAACLGNILLPVDFNAQTTPVKGRGYDVINEVQGVANIFVVSADVEQLNAAELSTPVRVADRVMGFNSQALVSPPDRQCGSPDAAPLPLVAACTNDSVLVSSEDDAVHLSQRTCVENKQALTIPSFEVNTSLESGSVSKPKFFGKDLIPTVQLERLCRSASPTFGKSFLNINAPSYVPKSLMQLVPHSKHLPTDDELVKQMDLYDTKGILARQVGSFQERVTQGHYLVEGDDLFVEEEFEEESTAHNFSMVAREGDLSPRDIQDNASKRVRRVRRPLEPSRVQPTRSTKSKAKRSRKSKK